MAWTEHHGGYWVITDYEHGHIASSDPATFSSARTEYGGTGIETVIPKNPSPVVQLPIECDPPEHTAIRRVLNPIVSPVAVAALEPTIDRYVTQFIDSWIEEGSCDLVYELASPVSTCVTLEWLGFPLDNWEPIAHAFHDVMGWPPGSERHRAALRTQGTEVAPQLRALIAERRKEPRDDVVSYIVGQQIGGQPVSDEIALSIVSVLVAGGVDTTTSLTGSALVHLHRYPDDRARLIAEPELLEPATEEFLRVYPPVTTNARTVRRQTELNGCPMHVGDRVLISRWAANLDETAFPEANRFIIDRFPNRHTSFGMGPHRCAGSHLARAMFRAMIGQVLQRIPDFAVDEDGLVPYPDQGAFLGWSTIPVRFTPGRRRS